MSFPISKFVAFSFFRECSQYATCHIYGTFPIVESQERAANSTFRSLELFLSWVNALGAGDPDAEIVSA